MSKDDADRTSLLEKAVNRRSQVAPKAQGMGAPIAAASLRVSDRPTDLPPPPLRTAPGGRGPGGQDQSPVVTIDLEGLKAQGYLTPDADRTRVAEEFRIIKRPLLGNAFGREASIVTQGNLVMVTSGLPGEGKTYTAVNLAMSIAMEMDKTVLLVDADVGRARVHELLKIPMGPGLIDLLTDPSLDVGDVICRTNVPKLRVIPMGRYHARSTELLASEAMRQLTQELATRYSDRMVIFDSPPLLATSEAVVLAGLMGQLVFVVEADHTPQHIVRDALSLMDDSKPVGLVLNKIRSSSSAGYYGYGNYGYHGSTT
jgi:protein-tyrosine kinase